MIYLDNSSTTHKKPLKVKLACLKGVSTLSINPSRAAYKRALKGAEQIYKCREKLADFVGANPENVIFTSGCTMALNLGLQGTVKQNGHIITTIYEHNSLLRVLEQLKVSHNIEVTYIEPDKDGKIKPFDILNAIKDNTYMVAVNHISNVTGTIQDIKNIGIICKNHALLFLVDGAQSVGHQPIDMKKLNINLLTIAGHKGLFAPQGIGALIINNAKVLPIIYGGTGTYSDKIIQPTDYPDGLESGTPNIVGILGLSAGIDFASKTLRKANKKITILTTLLINGLNEIKNVQCFSTNYHSGVVSFAIENFDSVNVSSLLDEKFNIATRSGLHCAPLVHTYFQTLQTGMTRISINYFNKKSDIKKALKAIKSISFGK